VAKRKDILNAALKALLSAAETSAWVKVPATFIAEIASLPKDKRDAFLLVPTVHRGNVYWPMTDFG